MSCGVPMGLALRPAYFTVNTWSSVFISAHGTRDDDQSQTGLVQSLDWIPVVEKKSVLMQPVEGCNKMEMDSSEFTGHS